MPRSILKSVLWTWLKRPFLWIDAHDGLITAFATVAIVLLTFVYVTYSRRQWELAQRQLNDYEASTGARLTIEDFNPTLTAGPGQRMSIRGSLKVSNEGNSVASEIHPEEDFAAGRLPLRSLPELKPTPAPNGPSIGVGKSTEYPVDLQAEQWDAVARGELFVGVRFAVSYKNIFGEPKVTPACFMYYRALKGFRPCR
jgi:hypothetical protein